MIINGGSRSNGVFFAKHLANGENNERVTLCEMRNLAATNISDAFREMNAVASGTLCKNYFYHANINPTENERLTHDQWAIAVDTLERYLLLTGHSRFIVEHQKKGRTHRHVIWLRINVTTMRAVDMDNNYAKHEAAARDLEAAFGLAALESVLGPRGSTNPRPARRPKTWETFRGQHSGIDPIAMTKTLTQLFHECADGAAFAAAIAEHGLTLVRGRASICIRDAAGHLHSLARRLDRVSASELRAFLRDLPIAPLPATT
jgi:Relaxase/Mobilisation nuclease domain